MHVDILASTNGNEIVQKVLQIGIDDLGDKVSQRDGWVMDNEQFKIGSKARES